MAKEIKIIQVAFNVLDPDQLQLYNHVKKRPNKSGYIKRLIHLDLVLKGAATNGIYH